MHEKSLEEAADTTRRCVEVVEIDLDDRTWRLRRGWFGFGATEQQPDRRDPLSSTSRATSIEALARSESTTTNTRQAPIASTMAPLQVWLGRMSRGAIQQPMLHPQEPRRQPSQRRHTCGNRVIVE